MEKIKIVHTNGKVKECLGETAARLLKSPSWTKVKVQTPKKSTAKTGTVEDAVK